MKRRPLPMEHAADLDVRATARRSSPANRHQVWVRFLHTVLFGLSIASAWGLALAVSADVLEPTAFPHVLATVVISKAVAFELFRLHRYSWRWFGLPDAVAITIANTSGLLLGALILGGQATESATAAVLIIDWLASQALLLGSGILYRTVSETMARKGMASHRRKRVLIYGAGAQGLNMLRRIRNPNSSREVVGFIDDDPANRHLMIQMTPVLGSGDELPRLARLHGVEEVLVAVRSPTPETRRRIATLAEFAGIPCRFRRQPPAPRHRRTGLACERDG